MTSTKEIIETAREVKAQTAAACQAHRSRGHDPATLRALLAREQQAGTKALAQLRTQHQQAEQERATAAGRAIYGADDLRGDTDETTFAGNYRAAQAQAADIDSASAARVALNKADRSGDRLLARAIAAKAVERNWQEVRETYAQAHPEWREAVAKIADTQMSTGLGIVFGLRPAPELRGVDPSALERIVNTSRTLYAAVDAGPVETVDLTLATFGN